MSVLTSQKKPPFSGFFLRYVQRAASVGAATITSNMISSRAPPTMTVLVEGRALLADGSNLNMADIYSVDSQALWTASIVRACML